MRKARKPGAPRLRAGLLLAFSAGLGWYGWTYCLLPEGASTVSLLYAADTFHQCSRETPQPDGAYWVPTAAQIRVIESSLPSELRKGPDKFQEGPHRQYYLLHQYLGFTLNGRRFVYVNGGPDDWRIENVILADEGTTHSLKEKAARLAELILPKKPFRRCDGGAYYWGVVYDPVTAKFQALKINGN